MSHICLLQEDGLHLKPQIIDILVRINDIDAPSAALETVNNLRGCFLKRLDPFLDVVKVVVESRAIGTSKAFINIDSGQSRTIRNEIDLIRCSK